MLRINRMISELQLYMIADNMNQALISKFRSLSSLFNLKNDESDGINCPKYIKNALYACTYKKTESFVKNSSFFSLEK